MMTIHPSEPILAYVGASRMTEPPTRLDVLRSLLSSCLEGKLTKIGDVGEMVSYLLLLFAFDERQFAEPDSAQSDPDKGFYSDNFWKRSMRGYNQTHGNRHSHEQTLEVGDGLFNHFANLRNPPTMKTFKDASGEEHHSFYPPNFPGADLLIPIYITVSITRVSAIQVKNRKNDKFSAPVKSQAVASLQEAVSEIQWS